MFPYHYPTISIKYRAIAHRVIQLAVVSYSRAFQVSTVFWILLRLCFKKTVIFCVLLLILLLLNILQCLDMHISVVLLNAALKVRIFLLYYNLYSLFIQLLAAYRAVLYLISTKDRNFIFYFMCVNHKIKILKYLH